MTVFIYEPAEIDAPSAKEKTINRRWHAVGIVPTARSCDAARACRDRRYLSAEAPALPLKGCDAVRCECRYGHFDDRRRGPRRGEEKGGIPHKATQADRRERRGRRATDHSTG
jgi:hypothetical protein